MTETACNTGCDCPTCVAGDDQWCCRDCHDIARSFGPVDAITLLFNSDPAEETS